ncbi:MAG: two-partner secretion domain-containing protein, partial [Alphaproteobacteria bacterium]
TMILTTTGSIADSGAGGTLSAGLLKCDSGTCVGTSGGGSDTTITQTTQKAVIDWDDFSVARGNSATFDQPNSASVTLNRVIGPNGSVIDGLVSANGQIWLINSNGVLFGADSQMNVGGLIATTSDISNTDFLNGQYDFGIASENANASVINQGSIITSNGGSVLLSGPSVENQGVIEAELGSVVLGGADSFSVDCAGDNLFGYAIEAPVSQTPTDEDGNPISALVENSGQISAPGGKVLMTIDAAKGIVNGVLNNTGLVEATSVASVGGVIVFGGGDGTVNIDGIVDASGAQGGSVEIIAGDAHVN